MSEQIDDDGKKIDINVAESPGTITDPDRAHVMANASKASEELASTEHAKSLELAGKVGNIATTSEELKELGFDDDHQDPTTANMKDVDSLRLSRSWEAGMRADEAHTVADREATQSATNYDEAQKVLAGR